MVVQRSGLHRSSQAARAASRVHAAPRRASVRDRRTGRPSPAHDPWQRQDRRPLHQRRKSARQPASTAGQTKEDRKSFVWGKVVSVRVDLCVRRIRKKKTIKYYSTTRDLNTCKITMMNASKQVKDVYKQSRD